MQVSGFSVVRNAIRYDYPFIESIRSILGIVDEFVLAVGDCDDGTLDALATINSPKLRVLHTVWDPEVRRGGLIISQQTNLALDECRGDWCFYLQADEVIHENELDRIQDSMRKNLDRPSVEGLTFRYHHFRADYGYRDPLPYRRQTRIVRRSAGARSYGDGCGFTGDGRKLKTVPTGCWVYHYGYVKPPQRMAAKMDYFCSLYDGRNVQPGQEVSRDEYDWDCRTCERFVGTHPAVMHDRIAAQNWTPPSVPLTPRWRNGHYYRGLAYKNSRTLRRWAGVISQLLPPRGQAA